MPGDTLFGLAGRSALVTGAASGLGAAVAEALSRAGAAVLVTDVDAAGAATVAEKIVASGGVAGSAELDVRDEAAAAAAVAQASALSDGTLHVLVNNAGVTSPAMFPAVISSSRRRRRHSRRSSRGAGSHWTWAGPGCYRSLSACSRPSGSHCWLRRSTPSRRRTWDS